jgi:prepilin peptidase CpaA
MFVTLACSVALVAGIFDARDGRIPNWLTLPGIAIGLGLALCRGGPGQFLLAATGLLLSGGIPGAAFFLTRGRALGGGDVKIWALLGTLLGPGLGLSALLISLCLLCLFSLVREVYFGRTIELLRSIGRVALRRTQEAELALTTMRFGPAILVGTAMATYPELCAEIGQLWK